MKSTRPFPETFRGLREIQGLSEREVSASAKRHGGPSHSVLNRLYRGENHPLPYHLRAVAAALGVGPETFAEYRLWQVISMFDVSGDNGRGMEPIPWDRAMHNLKRFEELTAAASHKPDAALDAGMIADSIESSRDSDPATGGRA